MEKRRVLTGIPISEGVAKAEAYHYEDAIQNVEKGYLPAGEETKYWKAFQTAKEEVKKDLQLLREQIFEKDEKAAAIFAAHIAILEDEDLLYEIRMAILQDRIYPEIAIEGCFGQYSAAIQMLEDDSVASKYIDVQDVKVRLLSKYLKKSECNLAHIEKDVIVVARELLPSVVTTINREHVKGIIIEDDFMKSHTGMIAKRYGIPMIAGVKNARDEIPEGIEIELDAISGNVKFE